MSAFGFELFKVLGNKVKRDFPFCTPGESGRFLSQNSQTQCEETTTTFGEDPVDSAAVEGDADEEILLTTVYV